MGAMKGMEHSVAERHSKRLLKKVGACVRIDDAARQTAS
jgi:hypothetical protein